MLVKDARRCQLPLPYATLTRLGLTGVCWNQRGNSDTPRQGPTLDSRCSVARALEAKLSVETEVTDESVP